MVNIIQIIVSDVHSLNDLSNNIEHLGQDSNDLMQKLSQSNQQTNAAIDKICKQVIATNTSAQKIQEAIDIMSSIASQTNLLSLNASIPEF